MPFGLPTEVIALVLFLAGVVLVIVSVETFIEAVAESALSIGLSGFFLTVVLAGTDLENAILGLAAVADGLPDLALGTVFGEALFVLGAAVGLAGVLTPFETSVPRSYLLLVLLAPSLLFALALDGTLSRVDGVLLTAAFLPLLGVVYGLERNRGTRYLSAEEVEEALEEESEADNDESAQNDSFRERYEGWYQLGVALVATVGMTVGSELAVTGARDLLSVLGVTGLVFGATVMSFVASLEELFLTVEPARQGRPHLGVGNVVGSVLFFVTANVGVLALFGPIDTSGTVMTVHWPFFLVALLAVAAVFVRGWVGRPEGFALLGLYAAYWGVNYLL
ncbi:sodium:calcium antiporter [Halalkalicoccus jeotgali]|uniref:Sodium/calcium exchanger membrane region n=1 Tax=Halalkalicoccus jeotgali (strain DSM 18796 / CECT 7217 / JCM 14584 / KCTC 4019 / B3) TaxID=795797 RepID=D8J9E1_HALJB|nr:sodium/hydrogen exchanger [Halalkalicoccus jeotgali]ADJ14353.1 sodium/calcium exchanger membrane region [Halalkalicoccus jeotgali B3]ELY40616.1 sodium/calcium exchanger membrane subunit [Halalkalicoccus jeotgali B3]